MLGFIKLSPDVSSVLVDIHAVAADVGQVMDGIAQVAGFQIMTEIDIIVPQVGAVMINIGIVRSDVSPISMHVSELVLPPAGRGDGWSQSTAGDHGSGSQRDDRRASQHWYLLLAWVGSHALLVRDAVPKVRETQVK
jgi:hypothetical protein